MFLQLDNQGPRYAQLTRALKQAILSGRCAPATRLPATRTLARELELSRNTVLAAYEQLAAEGFIEGRVGSGCYVSAFANPVATPAGVISFRPPPVSETAVRRTIRREPRLARRGLRMRDLYEVKIPGRQHRGLRYNLQYGMPMTNPQLASAWRRELSHAAAHMATDYPDPQGLPALREQVCDYLARRRGVIAAPDDILIVSGTQQAFALAAEVLLDEGDGVVIEDPHYQGARQVLQASGAEVTGCRVDHDGIVTADLPQRAVRLAVVTPSHQFPTGAVLSLARRMELLAWAERTGCWLIEDDYDGEFRYDARPLAALKSLDRAGQVLYIGTFSKVLFPALRLGYMVLPPQLRDAFVAAKWLTDRGCPAIEQAALARLMSTGAFERHLRATAKTLKTRRAALLAALRRHARNDVEVADSSAGMHVLAWLPQLRPAQVRELIERARERGVGLYPIAPYYLEPQQRQGLLLGYADLPPADLDTAMRVFGECLRAVSAA